MCFERFKCVMEYVGEYQTKESVEEYDEQVLVCFLMKVVKHINIQCVVCFRSFQLLTLMTSCGDFNIQLKK
jgi:hypothetical protein